MKTTTIILATLLTLQISSLFAANESITATPATEVSFSAVSMLAPSTPAEADFTDAGDQTIDIRALAPVSPAVADFE